MNRIITEDQFIDLVEPFIGKSINRSWKGYGSALFLEVGDLSDGKGELSIMIEWSWRVEKRHSIWFGSWSEEETIVECIPQLTGYQLKGIALFSRLPEISVNLSQDVWINSFSTVEGNPEWALLFNDQEMSSRLGKIILKRNESTEQII